MTVIMAVKEAFKAQKSSLKNPYHSKSIYLALNNKSRSSKTIIKNHQENRYS